MVKNLSASSHLMSLERVRNCWKDDALFGYQFLNGANPMLLRRSTSLPSRLVLPLEMEDLKSQLEKELQVLCFICSPITPAIIPVSFSLPHSSLPPSLISSISTCLIYTLLHLYFRVSQL